ncbi:MAG: hypothetical protein A2Y12_03720 [Planctomycetes bacterium GWF2_42_9]|nr:MAG: hypothetical protein A2Y12_03720 [Planctomycetes bacterium GWF2_42_9]
MIFKKAKWIWDGSSAENNNYYVRARKNFEISTSEFKRVIHKNKIVFSITAHSLYQLYINGTLVGNGPAKSAAGRRSVDTYNVKNLLKDGSNQIDIIALNFGTGMMIACFDVPGIIFELSLPSMTIASNKDTLIQKDMSRKQQTVRRWLLPCLEDVSPGKQNKIFKPATVVKKDVLLYHRRVPYATREAFYPARIIREDIIEYPNSVISFRIKPYIVSRQELKKCNIFSIPTVIVTDIVSPRCQIFEFTPALGNITWFFKGKKVFNQSGWAEGLWQKSPKITLNKGENRLLGLLEKSHYEDVTLAGRSKESVMFKNPMGKGSFAVIRQDKDFGQKNMPKFDINDFKSNSVDIAAEHIMSDGNLQAYVAGAKIIKNIPVKTGQIFPIKIGSCKNRINARRIIIDLGKVVYGYLCFKVKGSNGSRLIFSMAEGMDVHTGRVQWVVNNAMGYMLSGSNDCFESFLPYGVRYIVVSYTGYDDAVIEDIRVESAYCGAKSAQLVKTGDNLLDMIVQNGINSMQASTDDTFNDCPSYEQVSWNFDNRLIMAADFLTMRNVSIAANSLLLFAEDIEYKGLVRCCYPGDWQCQIPLWSFHWIMDCWDFYKFTGDKQFLKKVMPQIKRGIFEVSKRINKIGLLEWKDVWHFVDWKYGRDDDHAINTAEQSVFVGALDSAIKCATITGQPSTMIKKLTNIKNGIVLAINKHLWNSATQSFADSLHEDGSLSLVSSKVANAIACLYGVAGRKRTQLLYKRICASDSDMLDVGSPFGLYYIFELMEMMGDYSQIMNITRNLWGKMVAEGDKTNWEQFGEYKVNFGFPTRSRCHGAAAFIIKYLLKIPK